MFHQWKDVPLRTCLGDCLDVFPCAQCAPAHLDIKADKETIAANAKACFLAMNVNTPSCLFGSLVQVLNPERDGGIEARARHITHFKDQKSGIYHPDVDKCQWVPSLLGTIEHADAVLEDRAEGTILYARRHSGWGFHFVVVKPKLRTFGGFVRGQVGGFLITQFSHGQPSRQKTFPIVWKRQK